MLARVTRFSLSIVAAMAVCGCRDESRYNVPPDESKDAAAIAAGTARRKVSVGRKKVTKPPGVPLKDSKGLQPSD